MNEKLFKSLKELRLKISREKGIPPFVIYNDTEIKELVNYCPKTLEELEKIKDFSKSKITKYGYAILKVINENK